MAYDVIIIGAGPTGAMAATRLVSAGVKLAVLEKATLPRRKPCGGALTPQTIGLLEPHIHEVIHRRLFFLRTLFAGDLERVFQSTTHPMLYLVERRRFDHHILQQALQLGGRDVVLKDNFPVRQVEENRDSVTVTGKSGERLTAKYVIAGDGAFSPTARCLGVNPAAGCGWAIDAEVVPDEMVFEKEIHRATIHFGCVTGGYGWIFPKQDYLSCGVGILATPAGLTDGLEVFLTQSFPNATLQVRHRSVHPIPVFRGLGGIATGRICLAGDAAGLADPISGEGIRYALESGNLAADAVFEALEDTSGAENRLAATYVPKIHDGIGKNLDALSRFALPVYQKSPEFFYRKFFLEGAGYRSAFRNLAHRIDRYSVGSPSNRPL